MSIMVIDAIYPQDPLSAVANKLVGKKIDNGRMSRIKDRDWSGIAILQENVVLRSTEKSGVKQTLDFGIGCPVFFHWVRLITPKEAEKIEKRRRAK